jgi:hypothetical protein
VGWQELTAVLVFSEVPKTQGNQNELNVLKLNRAEGWWQPFYCAFILCTYPRSFMKRL